MSFPGTLRLAVTVSLTSYVPFALQLSLWIANPPLMAHHQTEIDAAYDWTAGNEVNDSPREFKIVENCQQFETLYDSVYDPKADVNKYFDYLQALKGHGRLWITGSKVTHRRDDEGKGTIESMAFSVEINLPN